MIYVPIGLDEKKYENGTWIKVVELNRFVNLVRLKAYISYPVSYPRRVEGGTIAQTPASQMDWTME